jgi:hypothetical protein
MTELLLSLRRRPCWTGEDASTLGSFPCKIVDCLHGVRSAMELGIVNIIMETDPLMVHQAVNSEDFRRSALGGLITELKHLLYTATIFIVSRLCINQGNVMW